MKRVTIHDKHTFDEFNLPHLEGEPIEDKIRRILDENEPITDGAPIIYTERKDGVRPEFDIRADKWEIAIQAMDKVSNYEASKYLQTGEMPEIKADYKETETTNNETGENSPNYWTQTANAKSGRNSAFFTKKAKIRM